MNFQSSKNGSNFVCEKILFANPVTYNMHAYHNPIMYQYLILVEVINAK